MPCPSGKSLRARVELFGCRHGPVMWRRCCFLSAASRSTIGFDAQEAIRDKWWKGIRTWSRRKTNMLPNPSSDSNSTNGSLTGSDKPEESHMSGFLIYDNINDNPPRKDCPINHRVRHWGGQMISTLFWTGEDLSHPFPSHLKISTNTSYILLQILIALIDSKSDKWLFCVSVSVALSIKLPNPAGPAPTQIKPSLALYLCNLLR